MKTLWRLLVSVAICGMLFTPSITPARAADAPVPALAETPGWDPCVLTYGLYWVGTNNTFAKSVAGQANPYYNAARPTVIYVHGWEKGTTARGFRETFNWYLNDKTNGLNINTANAWLNAGWNVGIFYWNQFSDENEVKDAEAKIWTATGPQGMRWRKCDGSYPTANRPTVSAAQLFYNDYTAALAGYTGNNIRIVGHSLGSQMAIRLAKMVSDNIATGQIAANLRPTRVALADPFWSNDGKTYLAGKWTGQVSREYVAALKPLGTSFEYYLTSNINSFFIGDSNQGMRAMTAFSDLDMTFVKKTLSDPSGNAGAHVAAPNWYFLSYAYAAPVEYTCVSSTCTPTGLTALSAKTADSRVTTLMSATYYEAQLAGMNTATPSDDTFKRVNR